MSAMIACWRKFLRSSSSILRSSAFVGPASSFLKPSKADFKNKVRISLREARESNYWLRVIKALERSENEQLESLIQESKELKNILASIINNTKL